MSYSEIYEEGFKDGRKFERKLIASDVVKPRRGSRFETDVGGRTLTFRDVGQPKPKRKLSPWNKFVKANSKKPRFIYKSGSNKGKLNLKKMGVAFRKTPAGKRKK